jgi:hypothetical protein
MAKGALFFILAMGIAAGPLEAAGSGKHLDVFVSRQELVASRAGKPLKSYTVSTSRFGIGNLLDSNQTPLGRHRIARKIGAGAAPNTIFRNRINTGAVSEINRSAAAIADDRITSRILWLEGLEPGVNRGGRVDSYRRQIYIHGTADEGLIGRPASHGCIRMRNTDVIQLFDWAEVGTTVTIHP